MRFNRLNRIRIAIIDDMRRLRKLPFSVYNVYRHDLLQRRLDKCNLLLFGDIQPFNHEYLPLNHNHPNNLRYPCPFDNKG